MMSERWLFFFYNLPMILSGIMFFGGIVWIVHGSISSYRFDRYIRLRFRNIPDGYGSTLFRIYGTVNYKQDLPELRGRLYVVKDPEGILIKEIRTEKGRFFDSDILMNFPLGSLNPEERIKAVKNLRLYFINFPTVRKPRIIESEVEMVSVVEQEPYSFSMTLECDRKD